MENNYTLSVEPSAKNFEYWLNRPYVDDGLRSSLSNVNLLIVPWETYPGYDGPVFPQGSDVLLSFLQTESPKEIVADACISDDDYLDLTLHHDIIEVGMMVVSSFIAPIVVDRVKKYLEKRRDDELHIKIRLTIVNADHSAKEISFEGPYQAFEPTVRKVLGQDPTIVQEKPTEQ